MIGVFRPSKATTSVVSAWSRRFAVTAVHPSEQRNVDYRVPIFSDMKFVERQLDAARHAHSDTSKIKRLESILQCYKAMDMASTREWQSNSGVPYVAHHESIGDMHQFISEEQHRAWTEAIAGAALNLDLYPLHRLDSTRGQELVEHISQQLSANKTVFLKDFLRPEAVEVCSDLFEFLHNQGRTHFSHSNHNVYFSASDPEKYPQDHPVNMHGYRSHGFLAGDFLHDEHTILKHIFRWQPFRTLIERALNLPNSIYCSRDPINQIVCNVQQDGEQFPWHFDGNEYIVTLTLREAEEGGELWTAPDMRAPGDENIDSLKKLLVDSNKLAEKEDGTQLEYTKVGATSASHVKTYKMNPGDLQFFMGRYCLHKITKVSGNTNRQVAIFAFSDDSNFVNPVSRSILNCGRAYPMHYERQQAIQRDHL